LAPWGKKLAKISDFEVFPTGNPQIWINCGQIWHGVANVHALPNLTPIGALIRPCGVKNRKSHFKPAVSCQ